MVKSAVVITGASTGIGFSCALRMAAAGHRVFAGVRKPQDAARLQQADGEIVPVIVDVASDEQVAAAVEQIARALGDTRLLGLVNNAGVALGGPLELVSMGDFRRQFDVNVFGAVAMTKALLPQLRAARGRIVNISSLSGMVATPGFAPYASSKFALEAVTDSLRRELRPQGIFVCAVQPGAIQTAIWDKGKRYADVLRAALTPELSPIYAGLIAALERDVEKINAAAVPSEDVADAVEHALTSARPRLRYRVGPNSSLVFLMSLLPAAALDFVFAHAWFQPDGEHPV